MIVYLSFLFALLSIFGVAFSPDVFNRPFCAMEMTLYVVFGGMFMRHKIKRNGLICFDTFFIPSYLLVNYAHAVFIYPDDQFLPAFLFATRSEVIPYAISIAQLGIAMYMLASVLFEKTEPVGKRKKIEIPQMTVKRTAVTAVLAGFGIFAYIFLTNRVQEFIHLFPRLMALIMALITLSWYYQAQQLEEGERGIKTLIQRNKLNILAVVLFSSSQLYIGSRSEVILLMFVILLIVDAYYIKVKFKLLLPAIVVSIILMGLLMITRVSKYSLMEVSVAESVEYGFKTIMESPNILWVLLTDFVVNAKTLYESVDYVSVNGFLYGLPYIPYLFVFLPMGGSLMVKLLIGEEVNDLASGVVLSYFSGATYGLGMNLTGDLYINLSIIGVCVMMFLLGLLLARVESPGSKYQSFAYMALFAHCVFLVRADIFCWLTFFVFYVILDWLMRIHVNVEEAEEPVSEETS